MNFPITVVDDFFENPNFIRELALNCEFDYPKGFYPGFRTKQIFEIDKDFYNYLKSKILLLFFNQYFDTIDVTLECQFQYIPEYFEKGWVHQDIDLNNRHLAGVIYLSPDAPTMAGTSFYKKISQPDTDNLKFRNEFYQNNRLIDNEYRQKRDNHNKNFQKIQSIDNFFNRAAIYDTQHFHAESLFFGHDKFNSRLSLVFFMTVDVYNRTTYPLQRMSKIIYEGNLNVLNRKK